MLTMHALPMLTACSTQSAAFQRPLTTPYARARAAGKSLNEAAVAALADGAGVAGASRKRRDLGDIAGTWKADKALESALAAQDRVDADLWR